jgi:hypothetical protein
MMLTAKRLISKTEPHGFCYRGVVLVASILVFIIRVDYAPGQVLVRVLRVSLVSIIPLKLHTYLYCNATLIRRTSGRSVGNFRAVLRIPFLWDMMMRYWVVGSRRFWTT